MVSYQCSARPAKPSLLVARVQAWARWAPDGRKLAFSDNCAATACVRLQSALLILLAHVLRRHRMQFSSPQPCGLQIAARSQTSPLAGQYCVTHEPVLERLGKDHKNLKVWSCDDGELVAEFHRRGITDDHWPVIQFDAAETHVFFTVNNAIVYYSMDGDMTKADGKVKLDGVTQFKMGPAKRKLLATFVPESSKPAVFAVLDWEDGSTINRKNFYRVWRPLPRHTERVLLQQRRLRHTLCVSLPCRLQAMSGGGAKSPREERPSAHALQASRCNLNWNRKGSHVLCQSISDFDATNKSYFGESRLYLLSADGRTDMAITMEDDPSIVDVAWAPDGEAFVALGGHQPAKAVLYSAKGKVICKMATGPYNHIRWNAQGRFVLLAGFGNLPGDVQLLERTEEGTRTMGACRCAAYPS